MIRSWLSRFRCQNTSNLRLNTSDWRARSRIVIFISCCTVSNNLYDLLYSVYKFSKAPTQVNGLNSLRTRSDWELPMFNELTRKLLLTHNLWTICSGAILMHETQTYHIYFVYIIMYTMKNWSDTQINEKQSNS